MNKLGQGGIGETYLAKDTLSPENSICVVKRLQPQNHNPKVEELFNREAETLAKLGKHSQIPTLLDHIIENNEFYIVQELIEGQDLTHNLGKKWEEKEAIALLKDILDILKFVHENDVIHRDLKPANIMIRQPDKKVVLIDFGSVKKINNYAVNTQLQAPTIVFTQGYTPFEQLQGNAHFNSDIYALGIVIIQLVTGLNINDLQLDQNNQVISHHQAEISPQLKEILDKMVRFNSQERHQKVTEVLADLQQLNSFNLMVLFKSKWAILLMIIPITAIIAILIKIILIPSEKWETYQQTIKYEDVNYQATISLKYLPEQWKYQIGPESSEDVVRFFLKEDKINKHHCTDLEIQSFAQSIKPESLDDRKQISINTITRINPNSRVDDQTNLNTTLSHTQAYKLVYTRIDQKTNCNLKIIEMGVIKKNRFYIVTYQGDEQTGFNQFLSITEKMIETFEIND